MALSGEFELIKQIKKWVGTPSDRVEIGIGDDTAVVTPPQGKCLVTVDMMVEGTHFDLAYTKPEELGHKALAINLSDIAAMGGRPLYALVSLGLPSHLSDEFVEAFYGGMKRLADEFAVDIVGGNLTRSPCLLADLTVIGEPVGPVCLRSGARPGDLVAVTGTLGASAAGLRCLKQWGRAAVAEYGELVAAHLKPVPRLKEAMALNGAGAVTAMMDISDGLSSELHHVAKASRVGILVDESRLPVSEATKKVALSRGEDPYSLAFSGGEDYELLVALKKGGSFPNVTVIGEVTEPGLGVRVRRANGLVEPLAALGWDHFG